MKPRICAVATTAVIVVASIGSLGAARASSAEPDPSETLKVQQGAVQTGDTSGDAAALAQEQAAADQALPEDVSPGLYDNGGTLVPRLFKDQISAKSTNPRATVSRFSAAELAGLKKALAALHPKADGTYGFYYDARQDVVIVEGNLDRSLLPAQALARGDIRFTHTTDAARQSRTSDSTPHWGGSRITSGSSCSSAFIVQNSSGTRYAFTAAHCGALNSQWYSGSYYYGKMTGRGPFPAYDMALLSGSTYGTYIYMGNSTGTGWKTSTGGNPVVGVSYCTSGATTNESCSKKVTSLDGRVCDASGCTYSLAAYQGGTLTGGGDSGGPLVIKGSTVVDPRGVHIALVGSTMYAEKYNTVASHFGVSSVPSP